MVVVGFFVKLPLRDNVSLQPPDATAEVALVHEYARTVGLPDAMLVGFAVMVAVGAAGGVLLPPPPPPPPQSVMKSKPTDTKAHTVLRVIHASHRRLNFLGEPSWG